MIPRLPVILTPSFSIVSGDRYSRSQNKHRAVNHYYQFVHCNLSELIGPGVAAAHIEVVSDPTRLEKKKKPPHFLRIEGLSDGACDIPDARLSYALMTLGGGR